jgi:hypothetical protein
MDAGLAVLFSPSAAGIATNTEFAPALALGLGNHFLSASLSRTTASGIGGGDGGTGNGGSGGGGGALAFGINGYAESVPAGLNLSVSLAARRGVSASVLAWGEAARAQHGTARVTLDRDALSDRLGYMQDDGAYYCFCEYTDRHLNSSEWPGRAPAGEILTALQAYHASLGLSVSSYHIDPYWYASCPGDPRCPPDACGDWNHPQNSCVTAFDPNPWHFSNTTIRAATGGAPMMMFMSYSFNDPTRYSANYSWMLATWPWFDVRSSPAPQESARFWRDAMARHVTESNMRAMTLDTLQGIVYGFADNLRGVDRAEQMQLGYAAAAAESGLVFRVDCHNAPLAMSSLDQTAWVASRVTDDATPGSSGSDRDELAGAAVFMAALYIRPMMDVLWSTSVQPGDPYSAAPDAPSVRLNVQRDFALAVLSTGPVGIGDRINGTDVGVLISALRADSIVLKPAHPLLRLERYFAGDTSQLWAAVSVPARASSAALDRRANSLARLAPLGAAAERSSAQWWYSLLATNVAGGSVAPRDLFPPAGGGAFLASASPLSWPNPAPAPCTNGSLASACFALVDDAHPLAIDTGAAPDTQCAAAPNNSLAFSLLQLAPVLPSGWVLLGELSKVVTLSPQRFLVHAGAPAPAATDSDALDAVAELGSDGSAELSFRLVGAPGEVVELTLVCPAAADPVAAPAARAMAGTVLVLVVQLSASGKAAVRCGGRACSFPAASAAAAQGAAAAKIAVAAAAGADTPSATTGCSDGSCEGFCEKAAVNACNATWAGALSLRSQRSSANASCGGAAPCLSPADACAPGWGLCLGYSAAGDSAAALTAALSVAECAATADGPAGAYVAAMSSARRAPCPAAPPTCDMGCNAASYGAEPVCCGARCQVPSCASGVWPSPGTRIMMGAGVAHRECADMAGGFVDGVLCCRLGGAGAGASPPRFLR